MRLAPVALFFLRDPITAIEKAAESSRVTHATEVAVDACRYFAGLLVGALRGESKERLLSPRFAPIDGYWNVHPLHPEIDSIAAGSYKWKQPPEIRGSGFVVHCLEAALWAFHNSTSFHEGCRLAVNLGEDADTTGAVYGQLAGAFYGDWNMGWGFLARHAEIKGLADGLLRWGWIEKEPLESQLYKLNEAITAGDVQRVQNLLASGVPLNERDYLGTLPLTNAIGAWSRSLSEGPGLSAGAMFDFCVPAQNPAGREGAPPVQREICRIIRIAGGHLDIQTAWGMTAFTAARSDLSIFKWLLTEGANPDLRDGTGQTPLMNAAAHRAPRGEELGRILIAGGGDVNARDPKGETALMKVPCAVKDRGDYGLFELLLDSGADIHAQDERGCTALMHAANRGSSGSVKILIQHGANLNIRNTEGKTALSCVYESGTYETSDSGYYFEEARRIVDLLLDAGAEVACRHEELLAIGARIQSLRLVERVLSLGVSREAKNTALLVAVSARFDLDMDETLARIIESLLAAGADPNARNEAGEPALYMAIDGGWGDEVLAKHGADPTLTNPQGKTPLMVASEIAFTEHYIQSLLDMPIGWDVNQADLQGRTALFYALDNWEGGTNEVLRVLLRAGADRLIRNREGQTAMEVAISTEAPPEVVELLRPTEAGSLVK